MTLVFSVWGEGFSSSVFVNAVLVLFRAKVFRCQNDWRFFGAHFPFPGRRFFVVKIGDVFASPARLFLGEAFSTSKFRPHGFHRRQ